MISDANSSQTTRVFVAIALGGCGPVEKAANNKSEQSGPTINEAVETGHPKLDELMGLLSKKIDSPEVAKFKGKYKLKQTNMFGNEVLIPEDRAYDIKSRDGVVISIFLQVGMSPLALKEIESKTYSGKLPYEIDANDSREDIIKKLGKPTSEDGLSWTVDSVELLVRFYDDRDGVQSIFLTLKIDCQ